LTEAIVGAALRRWGLADAPYRLAAARENRVYRVEARGGPLALRLHRRGYRSRAEILSELQWMAMPSDAELSLPRPHATPDGELCVAVEGTDISIVSWLEGIPLGTDGRLARLDNPQAAFRALGECMARLHEVSDRWTPPADFERPAWDIAGLLGDEPLWGRFWENPELTGAQAQQLFRARAIAREQLSELAPALDYGLIHADLVPENVLLHCGLPQLIDFDDGGFGFRLFELATTVNRAWREDGSGALAAAVLDGYQSVRAIDLSHLRLLRAVRSFTYLAWIVPRLNEPGAAARCRRYQELALEWASRLIAGPL
jgi:Ser/Thr protein kinase RdoA (MazF antagonist)